ncbi:carbohydrate kinase [[Haemophilus] felis]|nr:carbohydrate kinase [[Haemophilus] felis]
MGFYLGIDCGGSFIKAAIFDAQANMVSCVRKNMPVISDSAGYAERDMPTLWLDCADVVSQAIKKAKVDPTTIKSVGISAQGKGLFLLDQQNKPLGRAILSSDQRTLSVVKQWQQEGIPERLYPLTRQTLWTGHPVSILRWIKENEPARYANIGSILMSHDYLRFCLTGKLFCEQTNISESNLYNMNTHCYDENLAQLLGLSGITAKLPPCVAPNQIAGFVTEEAATQTGLCVGTPVVGGLFDVVATALCANLENENTLNAVLGTWTVVSGVTTELDPWQTIPFVYGKYADADKFIVHEASPTSAGNLEWFVQQWKLNYQEINQCVEKLAPAASSVLFLPFLYGSNAGLGMQAGFYGIQAHHSQAHLLQAIYEGVLFSLMHHLARMKQRFPNANVLRVTGGPTKSPIWLQMLADFTGMTLEIPQVEETGCFGAALMAMRGVGVETTVLNQLPMLKVMPRAEYFQAYQNKYQRYQMLTKALQSML